MLELQNISYLVDDDNKEILRDINLAFDEKFVAITGPNGSGKSTLAKIIAGILKPTSGKILLDGKEVKIGSPSEAIANGVGMVHQHFKLVDVLSATENIVLGLEGKLNIKDVQGINTFERTQFLKYFGKKEA